eukprot:GHVU01019196.1.p1 GENE.GHVU01019196.1~~GHVU01019196.1.p1  ORF type:complete len:182 (+),score=35.82 GHVU01019196.1:848-1393(+)
MDASGNGSSSNSCQWENCRWNEEYPCVIESSSGPKPSASITGICASTWNQFTPSRISWLSIWARRFMSTPQAFPSTSRSHWRSSRSILSYTPQRPRCSVARLHASFVIVITCPDTGPYGELSQRSVVVGASAPPDRTLGASQRGAAAVSAAAAAGAAGAAAAAGGAGGGGGGTMIGSAPPT